MKKEESETKRRVVFQICSSRRSRHSLSSHPSLVFQTFPVAIRRAGASASVPLARAHPAGCQLRLRPPRRFHVKPALFSRRPTFALLVFLFFTPSIISTPHSVSGKECLYMHMSSGSLPRSASMERFSGKTFRGGNEHDRVQIFDSCI